MSSNGMRGNKILLFLIVFLAITAFWGGYEMVKNESGDSSYKTGSILDKFSNQIKPSDEDVKDSPKPVLLSDRLVVSPVNSLGGGVVYYEKNTGRIFEVPNEDSSETIVSNEILTNFLSALWSPNKKESILYVNSPEGGVFGYLNVLTGEYIEFDPTIRSVTFSPDGNLIAYYKVGENSHKIVVAQPNGLYPKTILNTRLDNIKLHWPTGDSIIIETDASELLKLSLEGELSSIFTRTTGLDLVWSPSGKKIIYSSFSGNEVVELSLKVRLLSSLQDQNLPAVIPASNCVWSIDDINILCVVPESSTSDNLYRVNTFTGSVEFMADLNMPVQEILLSPTEDKVIFIGGDNKLYSVEIDN